MSSDVYDGTIYGQVLPLDWDNDVVTKLAIVVDGEDEFIIEQDKNGQKLLDHIDMWINAEGLIKETDEEIRIRIRDFTLEDDNWNYGDDDKW